MSLLLKATFLVVIACQLLPLSSGLDRNSVILQHEPGNRDLESEDVFLHMTSAQSFDCTEERKAKCEAKLCRKQTYCGDGSMCDPRSQKCVKEAFMIARFTKKCTKWNCLVERERGDLSCASKPPKDTCARMCPIKSNVCESKTNPRKCLKKLDRCCCPPEGRTAISTRFPSLEPSNLTVSSSQPSRIPSESPAPSPSTISTPTASTELTCPSSIPTDTCQPYSPPTIPFSCIDELSVPVGMNNTVVLPDWTCSEEEDCTAWLYYINASLFHGNTSVQQDPPPFTIFTDPQTIPVTLSASNGNATYDCNFTLKTDDEIPPDVHISGLNDTTRVLLEEFASLNLSASATDNVDSILSINFTIDNALYSPDHNLSIGRHVARAIAEDSSGNIGFDIKVFEILERRVLKADAHLLSVNCTTCGNYSELILEANLTSESFDISTVDPRTVVLFVLGKDGLALQNQPISLGSALWDGDGWKLHFLSTCKDEAITNCSLHSFEIIGSSDDRAFDFEATGEFSGSSSSGPKRRLLSPTVTIKSSTTSAPLSPSSSPKFSILRLLQRTLYHPIRVAKRRLLRSTAPSVSPSSSPTPPPQSTITPSPNASTPAPSGSSPPFTPSPDAPTTAPSNSVSSSPSAPMTVTPGPYTNASSSMPSYEPSLDPTVHELSAPSLLPSDSPTEAGLKCEWKKRFHEKAPKDNKKAATTDAALRGNTGSGFVRVNAKGGHIIGGGWAKDFWIAAAFATNGEGNVRAITQDAVQYYVYLVGFADPAHVAECLPQIKCVYDPQFSAQVRVHEAPGQVWVGGSISVSSIPKDCGAAVAKGVLATESVGTDNSFDIGNQGVSTTVKFPSKGKDDRLFTKVDGDGGDGVGLIGQDKKKGFVFAVVKSVIDVKVRVNRDWWARLSCPSCTPAYADGYVISSSPGITIEYNDITMGDKWGKGEYK